MNGEEISEKIDALIEVNRKTQQWVKVLAWDRANQAVSEALGDDPGEYRLYEQLDGETSISEIIEEVDVPRRTAYTRLNEWQRVGIVSKVARGRYDKIASLDSLGIEIPEPESQE